jgi:2-polyprenyl-3-methyl-5-hydroxy-6-metoxy-1,4-benzoquinol methylase
MIPTDGAVVGSIGCGWGATEAQLVRQGRQVHGVDISAEAVRVAATRLTSARVVDPANPEPFEPNSLDGLLLGDVLEHLPRAWERLETFARAVRPGGWLAISVPNMRYMTSLYHFLVRGDWPEHSAGIFDETHVQVMTRRRLARWCEASGLTIERWFDSYGRPGTPMHTVYRTVDAVSLRVLHDFLTVQLQCLCRRPVRDNSPRRVLAEG